MKLQVHILVAGIILAGCASAGTKFDMEKAQSVKPGDSEASVIEKLGQPNSRAERSDGSKQIVWTYAHAETNGKEWIPFAGPFLTKTAVNSRSFAVTVTNGFVKSFAIVDGQMQAGFGD